MKTKLLLISIIVFSFLLAISGCSGTTALSNSITPTPTPEIAVTSKVPPTPIPTPTPTATPTPSPTPTPKVLTVEQLLAEAPEISGLTKEIQDGKVVYKAVEGNEYGIETGEFAGEYNENIVMEGENFGNISLIPVIAEHVLNDQLTEIPDGEKKLKVLLPIDSTQAGENKINISFENNFDNNRNKTTIINCDSKLDVLNNIPKSNSFYIIWFSKDGIDFMCPLSVDGTFGDPGIATNETIMNFLQTCVTMTDFDKSKEGTTVEIPFGSVLGNSDGKEIILACADSNGSYNIDSSTFVKIDNAFVSMTTEK